MDQYAQRITRDYPVRRKAQEKENMRTYLMGQLRALGYDAKLNDCGKAVNVIAGDPERASILYAAHYDTPLREPLPAILCPTRPVTYLLYQALTPVLALALCFAVSLGVTFALSLPNLTLPLFLVLLIGALAYLKYGPSEKNNVNANTSGVAALLRTAEQLTPRYRNDVCFLFLDGGSDNMRGAKGFRKRYPSAKEKPVLCLDCVGSGDELLILPGIIIGLSFHEAAHALVSYKLGDPTPKLQGRVTLNPLAHIDPIGFITLLFIGFGWGVPVEIDPRYYKNRRGGELLVSLAGVTTNLIMAVVFALLFRLAANTISYDFYQGAGQILLQLMLYVVYINLVLMIFNLIPVPPLDGFGVVTQIFHLERYDWYWKIYQYGQPILLVLIIFNIPSKIISPACDALLNLLLW